MLYSDSVLCFSIAFCFGFTVVTVHSEQVDETLEYLTACFERVPSNVTPTQVTQEQ